MSSRLTRGGFTAFNAQPNSKNRDLPFVFVAALLRVVDRLITKERNPVLQQPVPQVTAGPINGVTG